MNRTFLAVVLCAASSLACAMTAAVSPSTPQAVGVPGTKGDVGASSVPMSATTADARTSAESAPGAKPGRPNAATLTKPASVLAAPDVPAKSAVAAPTRAQAASSAQGARSKTLIVPPQVAAPARSESDAAWTMAARTSNGIRRGTLEGVNVNAGSFQVYGQKLSFNAQSVKVFNRDGRPGSVFALKNGAKVRFTIDPADAAQRRVAVFYVD